ncbi:MAG: DNA-methyltransferase [Candidatus Dormibacteria bacterium]
MFQTSLGRLYQGDSLDLLAEFPDQSVDLVFADPPFNLGKTYGPGVNDAREDSVYLDWCRAWISQCVRLLGPGGAFFLYNLPRWNVELGHALLEEGMAFRHWITVDIKLSLPIPGRLYPSHYSLLYYTKGKPRTFHRPRVPVPVCRHCGGDIKDYGGHRSKLNPEGLNLTDVWADIPPVRHRSTKSRVANELSPKFLRRILDIATEPYDVILDPFGGSGTTYAVAEEMSRRWVGIELADCDPIVSRLRGERQLIPVVGRGDAGKGFSKEQPKTRAGELPLLLR